MWARRSNPCILLVCWDMAFHQCSWRAAGLGLSSVAPVEYHRVLQRSSLRERERCHHRSKTAVMMSVCGGSRFEDREAFLGRFRVQHVNQRDVHDLRTQWSAVHRGYTLILAPCLMRDTENWFLGLADKSTPPVIITCSLITRRRGKSYSLEPPNTPDAACW